MDLNVVIPSGKYVVAVSGGVDSVVLLDLLAKNMTEQHEYVVAHFDHGIRHDSTKDAELVNSLAKKYGLTYESDSANLGAETNEADARDRRYEFLNKVKQKYSADALMTAHHQDDLIETSMINILRGTGRRGLSSLKSTNSILRPLLAYPKKQLIEYAKTNNLEWNEDSTNLDMTILRNHLRAKVVARMADKQRQEWLKLLNNAYKINQKLDTEIQNILHRGLHKNQPVLNRSWFIMLPHEVSKEVLLAVLYSLKLQDFDKKTIERLTVQIKTLPHGKVLQAVGIDIYLTKRSARFKCR
ncbi:MAG: tRNA lysidine(34) synthetase TilS [Prolixibacteraceae bacterium]|nr:tRNA lysidine(34) synthetase TilS [Prolixibacteraceae bacterium]